MFKHLTDSLERHSLDFWEAEDDKEPTGKADACIEAKGP